MLLPTRVVMLSLSSTLKLDNTKKLYNVNL